MYTSSLQYKIIHPVKYYRDYVNNDIRPDGRGLNQFRPAIINVSSIGTADGSAIVKIGNTTVVCGIKAELAKPKASEPENGFIVPNIELSPLCSPKFRPGAPTEEAQVCSKVLAGLIENSRCLKLTDLCVAKEKLVWTLYCDLVCFDHDGSIIDAAIVALVAALKTLRLPLVEYDFDTNLYKVNENVRNHIPVRTLPVASSFMIFDDNVIITDPNAEEEGLSTGSVTIAVSDGEICLIHKPGGSPLTPTQLEKCLVQALQREKSIQTLFNSVIENK